MKIRTENISKRYMRKSGEANHFFAVKPVSLTLEEGRVTMLSGRSGSGKTTLLHMLAGLLQPTEGTIWLGETDLYSLEDTALSRLRNEKIGVIPQGRSAVETLTVRENILLPGRLYGAEKPEAEQQAAEWMHRLGIEDLADAWPVELSGGELRRMAIARALAARPEVLLADEPTGDLDDENTARVLMILREEARRGAAVLLVTHEEDARSYADALWRMNAGVLTMEA